MSDNEAEAYFKSLEGNLQRSLKDAAHPAQTPRPATPRGGTRCGTTRETSEMAERITERALPAKEFASGSRTFTGDAPEIADLRRRLAEALADGNSMGVQMADDARTIATLRARVETLKKVMAEVKQGVEDMRTSNADLRRQRDEANDTAMHHLASIAELEGQVKMYAVDLAALRRQLAEARASAAEWKRRAFGMDDAGVITALRQQLAEAQEYGGHARIREKAAEDKRIRDTDALRARVETLEALAIRARAHLRALNHHAAYAGTVLLKDLEAALAGKE